MAEQKNEVRSPSVCLTWILQILCQHIPAIGKLSVVLVYELFLGLPTPVEGGSGLRHLHVRKAGDWHRISLCSCLGPRLTPHEDHALHHLQEGAGSKGLIKSRHARCFVHTKMIPCIAHRIALGLSMAGILGTDRFLLMQVHGINHLQKRPGAGGRALLFCLPRYEFLDKCTTQLCKTQIDHSVLPKSCTLAGRAVAHER